MINDYSAQATGNLPPSHGLLRQGEMQRFLQVARHLSGVTSPNAVNDRLRLLELMLRLLLSRQLDIQSLPGDIETVPHD